jgi:D-alanyl-D-alanine carboxypeptidase/D-alanyl-D-alanine-endopeptidase (penicillin-binding protein 4)
MLSITKARRQAKLPHSLLLATLIALTGCAGTPTRQSRPPASVSPQPVATPVSLAAPATATPAPATPVAALASHTNSELAARIDALLAQPRFATAHWGIEVASLDSGRTLYAHNADKLAIPASNAKLYTTVLALSELGADYRFSTSLYATARARNGVLDGDLILYGRGDPALGSGSDTEAPTAWADRLAAAVAGRGIRQVRGALVADDTLFSGSRIGAGWAASDLQTSYAPLASALSVQENVFTLRVGTDRGQCCATSVNPSVAGVRIANLTQTLPAGSAADIGLHRPPGSDLLYVYGGLPANAGPQHYTLASPDPALMAAGLLQDALVRHGIRVDGGIRALHWPQRDDAMDDPGLVHIADLRSPPLADIVRHTLKHSDNLYAQLLLLQVGTRTEQAGTCTDAPRAPRTTGGWGACAMRALLRRIGIAGNAVLYEEGSGLSRRDLITPAATTRLLAWASRQSFAAVLRDALPVAGVDGTLRSRMRNSVAAGNLRAKTGTLRFTDALSGYVTDAAGERLVFSLLLNNYQRPTDAQGRAVGPSARDDLDAVAAMIAEHAGSP